MNFALKDLGALEWKHTNLTRATEPAKPWRINKWMVLQALQRLCEKEVMIIIFISGNSATKVIFCNLKITILLNLLTLITK